MFATEQEVATRIPMPRPTQSAREISSTPIGLCRSRTSHALVGRSRECRRPGSPPIPSGDSVESRRAKVGRSRADFENDVDRICRTIGRTLARKTTGIWPRPGRVWTTSEESVENTARVWPSELWSTPGQLWTTAAKFSGHARTKLADTRSAEFAANLAELWPDSLEIKRNLADSKPMLDEFGFVGPALVEVDPTSAKLDRMWTNFGQIRAVLDRAIFQSRSGRPLRPTAAAGVGTPTLGQAGGRELTRSE